MSFDDQGAMGLCSYYEQRGFRLLGTATLFGGMCTAARLFEREL